MGPEVIMVIGWEILRVDGGEKHGVADFVYGIIKRDINSSLKAGDYVFSTPLIEFDDDSLVGSTMDALYKLEGPGRYYRVTAEDALIMKNTGVSYKTLQELKCKGLVPREWYRWLKARHFQLSTNKRAKADYVFS